MDSQQIYEANKEFFNMLEELFSEEEERETISIFLSFAPSNFTNNSEMAKRNFDLNNNLPTVKQVLPKISAHYQNYSETNCSESHYTTECLNCLYPNCSVKLADKDEQDKHIEDVHGINRLRCLAPNCNASFHSPTELGKHLNTKHADTKSFPCSQCLTVTNSHKNLQRHMYRFHFGGIFACKEPNCHFTGVIRNQMTLHYRRHHKEVKQFQCTFGDGCTKSFCSSGKLKRHKQAHLKQKKCTFHSRFKRCNPVFAE